MTCLTCVEKSSRRNATTGWWIDSAPAYDQSWHPESGTGWDPCSPVQRSARFLAEPNPGSKISAADLTDSPVPCQRCFYHDSKQIIVWNASGSGRQRKVGSLRDFCWHNPGRGVDV